MFLVVVVVVVVVKGKPKTQIVIFCHYRGEPWIANKFMMKNNSDWFAPEGFEFFSFIFGRQFEFIF